MSKQAEPQKAVVTLTLNPDGDVIIDASEGVDMALCAFILGLAQHKHNMSYFGMVVAAREAQRKEDERKRPKLLIPQ